MIVYLATEGQLYTLKWYLDHMGPALTSRFTLMTYDELFANGVAPPAHYIFSDLERLSLDDLRRAARVHRALQEAQLGARLLNHPLRSMRRYELQRHLRAAGINSYNVYRATDVERPGRYPVFLRGENDHQGNITGLLNNETELRAAIERLVDEGESREDKLIVEFTDVRGEDGQFHKYGAQIIGNEVIAVEHLLSSHWVIKEAIVEDPTQIAAFQSYLDLNPHAQRLAGIFQLANIQYGRIDYALREGRIEVFEINTNPMLVDSSDSRAPLREVSERMFRHLQRAFESVDTPLQRRDPVPFDTRLPTPPEKRTVVRARHVLHDLLWSLGLRRLEPWVYSKLRSLYYWPRRLRERE